MAESTGVLAQRSDRSGMSSPRGASFSPPAASAGLFDDTTNPLAACGQGLALAARAGAVLADLEFIQFHPTALDGPGRPMPLISEAVRGEGAVIVDETGRRFLDGVPGAELAPRDVVARAVCETSGRRAIASFSTSREKPGRGIRAAFPDDRAGLPPGRHRSGA